MGRKWVLTLWAVVLSTLVVGCADSTAPAKPATQPQAQAKEDPLPCPLVHVRGTGAEMGASHGEQLGPQLKTLFNSYFGKYFHSNLERQMALMVAGAYQQKITPELRDEIKALAAKAGLEEREVMLEQCFLDATPMVACSTFTVPTGGSADGVARFGRNLDWPGLDIADKASVLMVFHPKDKFAFASVGWPGMLGVLSGMNEHGLSLCNMEVTRGQRLPQAMPYILLYRTVLEQCKTVDEAIELLNKTPRQTANNLMLMDAGGNRAVAEIRPEKVTVRKAPETQVLISTNHQRGTELNESGRCGRFDYLHEEGAKQFRKMDVEKMQSMLQHVSQKNMTLQSMIFEPSNRVMYLAVGKDAAHRKMSRIDLRKLFGD
ncbi:MAG TPA: C45 family peptidase [Tepidisphaeraceae bacterium]